MAASATARQQLLPLSHGRAVRSPHAPASVTAGVRSGPQCSTAAAEQARAHAPTPRSRLLLQPESPAAASAGGYGGLRTLGAQRSGRAWDDNAGYRYRRPR